MSFFQFQLPTIQLQQSWISNREGENRLGEKVLFVSETNDWATKRYHILGIKESVGPTANGGFSGAENAFDAFIPRFLAIQSNRFLNGDDIAIHGFIERTEAPITDLSKAVEELDEVVKNWTQKTHAVGGIPIVIGGGHNNAFGLIAGISANLKQPISVINLDPHADVRKTDKRHSGNSFSCAVEQGFLSQYSVLGLHQSYNNEYVLKQLDSMKANYSFFEDWLDDSSAFQKTIEKTIEIHSNKVVGLELDMDAIAEMPSSAYTPSGVSMEQARIFVRQMSLLPHLAYFHLPEAAPKNEQEATHVGKALSYLVSDFVKINRTLTP